MELILEKEPRFYRGTRFVTGAVNDCNWVPGDRAHCNRRFASFLLERNAPMHADSCRKERFQSFESVLALLRQALARRQAVLNPLEREGAIRRFEYCLDLAWKAAKEFLEDSGLRISPVTPREVFRQAVAAGVLADGQVWIDMLDHRNLLAHSYDGVVFAEVSEALSARYFPAMEQLRGFLAAEHAEEPARDAYPFGPLLS